MTKLQLPPGVFTATLTPQNNDLSINHEKFIAHCQWLLANGCNGLAVLGTTGEANSFSVKERIEALDALIQSGIPVDCLLVGTGCCAISDTVALTKHAVDHGVGGVLMLPPFYYKQVSDEGLFRVFEQVIQQVGDEKLKIYLYHFPKMTAVPFSHTLIERLIRHYSTTVVGIKDSSGDWNNMKFLCENFPGFKVYAGNEKFLFDILQIGGSGCISATTNVTSKIAGEIFSTWKSHEYDAARKLQHRLTELRLIIEQYPFVSGLKCIMVNFTDREEWLNMRPPNVPLNDEETKVLVDRLKSINFTEESL